MESDYTPRGAFARIRELHVRFKNLINHANESGCRISTDNYNLQQLARMGYANKHEKSRNSFASDIPVKRQEIYIDVFSIERIKKP